MDDQDGAYGGVPLNDNGLILIDKSKEPGSGIKRKIQNVSTNTIHLSKKPAKEFEQIFYDEDLRNTEFFILLDLQLPDTEENQKKRINDFKIFEILESLKLAQGIIRIQRIGFRRTKVKFQTATLANNVIKRSSELLKNLNLRAFIPMNFVTKYGIIRDVPKNMSEEKIMEYMVSDIPIRSITRLTRIDREDETKRINTNSVKIGFKGNKIPETVILCLSIAKIDYYIPRPKQCFQCRRLGHTQRQCKATKLHCLNCGKEGGRCNPSCTDKKCLLCGQTDHNCLDNKNCWKKKEQEDLNKVMAINSLSYTEGKNQYPSNNQFELLTDKNYEINFPEINPGNVKTRNNQQEVNKILRKHQTYNKVVANKSYHIPEPKKYLPPSRT